MKTRLFRYPCSYLIYSPAFDQLPPPLLQRVRDRLLAVLDGRDDSEPFQHLSAQDRRAIRELLLATKKGLR